MIVYIISGAVMAVSAFVFYRNLVASRWFRRARRAYELGHREVGDRFMEHGAKWKWP